MSVFCKNKFKGQPQDGVKVYSLRDTMMAVSLPNEDLRYSSSAEL